MTRSREEEMATESTLVVNERTVVTGHTIVSRHRGSRQDPIVRASLFRNSIDYSRWWKGGTPIFAGGRHVTALWRSDERVQNV